MALSLWSLISLGIALACTTKPGLPAVSAGPVIYCCHKDAFGERHFDTSVINHIVWNDPADLRKRLADRIKATILPKA